ncbi:MAG: DUF2948 family protein [Alphaproteobacteria bacterium]|nr:DUF2948 family protein [Alphaproteobacteria bacterium]
MVEDASFADGGEQPLRLQALDGDDLQVLSSLVQDAVFPMAEMQWQPAKRRFALLLNRFRWEDRERAESQSRKFERVQCLLVVDGVLKVASSGIDRGDKDMILSLMSVGFEAGEDGAGELTLTLAGDGALALDVEMLDISLQDVTRPYRAPSGHAPNHPE